VTEPPDDPPVRGITAADVAAWLRLDGDVDADLVADVVAATNAWVARTPYVAAIPVESPWPDDVLQGAVMLAARLFRRRNTPGGVEAFGADVVYVPRRDADVTAMLHLAAPRVG
jgi:hypothetical protein